MQVLNRHNLLEDVNFNKIKSRLLKLIQIQPELSYIKNDISLITQQVIREMHDKISTSKFKSLTNFLIMASCWKSFSPKMAT